MNFYSGEKLKVDLHQRRLVGLAVARKHKASPSICHGDYQQLCTGSKCCAASSRLPWTPKRGIRRRKQQLGELLHHATSRSSCPGVDGSIHHTAFVNVLARTRGEVDAQLLGVPSHPPSIDQGQLVHVFTDRPTEQERLMQLLLIRRVLLAGSRSMSLWVYESESCYDVLI